MPKKKRDPAEWAAYMRAYRERNPRLRKRPKNLDRSMPPKELREIDYHAYMRRYMRWYRWQKSQVTA